MKGTHITDDARIRAVLPTIKKLLKDSNKLIIISHLGRPDRWDERFRLKPIAQRRHKYLPHVKLMVIDDFTSEGAREHFENQKEGEILFLENYGKTDPVYLVREIAYLCRVGVISPHTKALFCGNLGLSKPIDS